MLRFLNARKQQSISKERLPAQSAVRIYERQADFARGVRTMQRQGWALETFNQVQSPDRLDMIRASAPGMLPFEARQQIVAHFACAGLPASTSPRSLRPRRRVARALVRVAERLDCTVAGEQSGGTCTNPA